MHSFLGDCHTLSLACFSSLATSAAHSTILEGNAQWLLRQKQNDSFIISFLATMCFFFVVVVFNNSGLLERGEKTVSGSPCPLFEKKTLLRGLNISLLYVHCSG